MFRSCALCLDRFDPVLEYRLTYLTLTDVQNSAGSVQLQKSEILMMFTEQPDSLF